MARPCGHGLVSIHFSLDRSVLVGLRGPRGEERGTEDLMSSELPGLALLCPPTFFCTVGYSAAVLQVDIESAARDLCFHQNPTETTMKTSPQSWGPS